MVVPPMPGAPRHYLCLKCRHMFTRSFRIIVRCPQCGSLFVIRNPLIHF